MTFTAIRATHRLLGAIAAAALGLAAFAAQADDAASLKARHAQLREALASNSFGRAMVIDSSESDNRVNGDVYAVIDHPFKVLAEALSDPDGWCDIMMLPFNSKYCRASGPPDAARLDVRIARKPTQPVQDAFRIDFALRPLASTQDFFESSLTAANGPVGTRDYRIAVSAIPLGAGKSFMHLSYSYAYGFAGRVAMQAYLATAGASKIGFSQSDKGASGEAAYTGGMRGAIERNAMRYYLAIDAQLASLAAPPEQRTDRRILHWFAATERYPKQLHEMERAQYVAMKRVDYSRAQAEPQ